MSNQLTIAASPINLNEQTQTLGLEDVKAIVELYVEDYIKADVAHRQLVHLETSESLWLELQQLSPEAIFAVLTTPHSIVKSDTPQTLFHHLQRDLSEAHVASLLDVVEPKFPFLKFLANTRNEEGLTQFQILALKYPELGTQFIQSFLTQPNINYAELPHQLSEDKDLVLPYARVQQLGEGINSAVLLPVIAGLNPSDAAYALLWSIESTPDKFAQLDLVPLSIVLDQFSDDELKAFITRAPGKLVSDKIGLALPVRTLKVIGEFYVSNPSNESVVQVLDDVLNNLGYFYDLARYPLEKDIAGYITSEVLEFAHGAEENIAVLRGILADTRFYDTFAKYPEMLATLLVETDQATALKILMTSLPNNSERTLFMGCVLGNAQNWGRLEIILNSFEHIVLPEQFATLLNSLSSVADQFEWPARYAFRLYYQDFFKNYQRTQ
jgi:hypothetical protein